MNKKLETLADIGRGIVGTSVIIGFIFTIYYAITTCSLPSMKPRGTYAASYGTFVSRNYYDFESYDYSNGRYCLYDKNHKIVADILVTGNNQFEIRTNR